MVVVSRSVPSGLQWVPRGFGLVLKKFFQSTVLAMDIRTYVCMCLDLLIYVREIENTCARVQGAGRGEGEKIPSTLPAERRVPHGA